MGVKEISFRENLIDQLGNRLYLSEFYKWSKNQLIDVNYARKCYLFSLDYSDESIKENVKILTSYIKEKEKICD